MVGDTLQVTGLPHCIIVAIAPTNSMEPVIDDGMFVVVDTGIPYGDLIPGDIIWFEAPGFAAIHRIIKVGQDKAGWYCETRGDNNGRADGVKVRPIYIKGVYRGQIT